MKQQQSGWNFLLLFIVSLTFGLFHELSGQTSLATSGVNPQEGEQFLFEIRSGAAPKHRESSSPDGTRVAWQMEQKGKWTMVVNGTEGPEFDEISEPEFISGRLVYWGRRKNRWFAVIEGKEHSAPEDAHRPIFDDEGKVILYWSKREKGWSVVYEGKTQEAIYDSYVLPIRSPDTKRIAYIAKRNGVPRAVVDGKEGPEYDWVDNLGFSPEGKHFAYVASRSGKKYLVVDGQEGVAFKEISDYAYSPDGTRLAYAAKRDKGKWRMTVDNTESTEFEDMMQSPIFSADSKHMAYAIWNDKKRIVILDGKPVREFPWRRGRVAFLERFAFSPDGLRLAYVVGDGGVNWQAASSQGREHRALRRVVVDSQEDKEYDVVAADNLRFSPDSRHFAYELHDIGKEKSLVILNGKEGKHYDQIVRGSLRFLAGNAISYVAREGTKFLRVTQSVQL